MKIIKLLFLNLSILFLLTACVSSSIEIKNKSELTLNYNKETYPLSNQIYDKKFLNYKDLFIEQYKTKNKDNRVLFYENAYTSIEFEFNFNDLYTILYIFDDAQKYHIYYQRRNLTLLQIQLKNKRYINVMMQFSDTQRVSYVYGFSNDEFIKIAQTIMLDDEKQLSLIFKGITLNEDSKPLTKWNAKMVFFAPLITPLKGMGRL